MSMSVVMPVRNQPGCVRWTLSSLVRQQGNENFEVVIVDDRSTDDTLSAIDPFRDQIDITVLRNEVNRGRSFSRNRGAAAATGEHLLFLDSDSYTTTDLVAGHQRWRAECPDDVVMGRRVEMGWWSMSRLALGQSIAAPHSFEEDQRDSRGLSDRQHDFYARTPWLFAATHNMSIAADTFNKVGGFDEALTGWGYEDNEFAYRVFRYFEREPGHFRYDGDLLCYHMPHFRDWDGEWENTRAVLSYIKDKHRHFDVEMLSHPPNHLRIAQTLPYYERCIAYLKSVADPAVADTVARTLPPSERGELWFGCRVSALSVASRGAVFFDHSRPESGDNRHLLGMHIPYADRSVSAVIGVDLWRILNPIDLSSFVMEALRVSDDLYLAMSKNITQDDSRRLGLLSDAGYLIDMLAARFVVGIHHDGDVTVLRCRPQR